MKKVLFVVVALMLGFLGVGVGQVGAAIKCPMHMDFQLDGTCLCSEGWNDCDGIETNGCEMEGVCVDTCENNMIIDDEGECVCKQPGGDFDDSEVVDVVDLYGWYQGYKSDDYESFEKADFNCDGEVDVFDLMVWYKSYKYGVPVPTNTPAPACVDAGEITSSINDCCTGLSLSEDSKCCIDYDNEGCIEDGDCCSGSCNEETHSCIFGGAPTNTPVPANTPVPTNTPAPTNTPTPACVDAGENTSSSSNCCVNLSYSIDDGKCCTDYDGKCLNDNECCSGSCDPHTGKCLFWGSVSCATAGVTVDNSEKCCNGLSYSIPNKKCCIDYDGSVCTLDVDCCSGSCNTLTGSCIFFGFGDCAPAGMTSPDGESCCDGLSYLPNDKKCCIDYGGSCNEGWECCTGICLDTNKCYDSMSGMPIPTWTPAPP